MRIREERRLLSRNWRERIIQRRSARWAKWVLRPQHSLHEPPARAQVEGHHSPPSDGIYMRISAANRNERLEAPDLGQETTNSKIG